MIYRFCPFNINKRIGDDLNAHCAAVPAGNWIQITDYDAMVLCRHAYEVMEATIDRYPECDIFGAMTNRTGYHWQRLEKENSNDHNLEWHYKIADSLAHKYKAGEADIVPGIAGHFMLFRQSYWQKHPFQQMVVNEKGKTFDKVFAYPAKEMRVIKGVYVYHRARAFYSDSGLTHLK
jgi:hypothetical protein